MKRLQVLFVILFTMLLTYNVVAQNWQLQNSHFPANIMVSNFSPVSDLVCWAGGITIGSQLPYQGYIRTIDGGNTWVCDSIPGIPDGLISQVFAIDADTAYIVVYVLTSSNSKGIYKTTDGGNTWTKQNAYSTAFYGPGCIHFFDANNGVVIGDPLLETYTTTNGGLTWNQVSMSPALADEYTWVGGTGIAGYGNSVWFRSTHRIFRSTDRGQTWTASPYEPQHYFWWPCIAFQDENTGIYSQTNNNTQVHIYQKTTNGGVTWSTLSNPILDNLAPSDIIHIPGTTATYLVAAGYDGSMRGLAVTFDAGENWSLWDTLGCGYIGFSSIASGWEISSPTWQVYKYSGAPIIVPVELTSFTLTASGKEVTLSWSTATELNNQGFEVQRKFGSNGFATIGSVKGNGTTTTPHNYTFVDKLIDAGKYFYRLKQMDYGGQFSYSPIVEVDVRLLSKYTLEQNYPNPFNPTTTIGFGIPASPNPSEGGALVTLKVYEILGNEVKTLVNKEMEAGYHSVDFDESKLPSGIYFYQLHVSALPSKVGKAGSFMETKKMMLLR